MCSSILNLALLSRDLLCYCLMAVEFACYKYPFPDELSGSIFVMFILDSIGDSSSVQ
jgi:hypothetical protein